MTLFNVSVCLPCQHLSVTAVPHLKMNRTANFLRNASFVVQFDIYCTGSQNAVVMDSGSDWQLVEFDYYPNVNFPSVLSDPNRAPSSTAESQPSSRSSAEQRSLGRTDAFCTTFSDPMPATTFQFANLPCTSNVTLQPNVFHSTRDMRECMLRRHKTELMERARCNFIQRRFVNNDLHWIISIPACLIGSVFISTTFLSKLTNLQRSFSFL
ncbi:uncharacterized protein DEA37_0001382 [Paragonimus westermani]|uniref:Uncharacterized protein n=1 Tax=Paragonimus westermani TaxID=34504 RepID=A0A5J4NJ24_9TREM|nr:uncharacterized protein DEA37_0001382 [Paragonimus westermani]